MVVAWRRTAGVAWTCWRRGPRFPPCRRATGTRSGKELDMSLWRHMNKDAIIIVLSDKHITGGVA